MMTRTIHGGGGVASQAEIEEYNYASFVGSENFLAFRTALQVGSTAPDFEPVLLDTGQRVKLSDYWADRDVLIEFGSLT